MTIQGADRDPSMEADCVFCAVADGRAPARMVYEDDHTVAFLDINPIVDGHTLVIPRRHTVNLLDTSDEDLAHTMVTAARIGHLLSERLGCDGVNLLNASGAAAWQDVFHLHLHVLPRFDGDDLPMPFIERFQLGTDDLVERERSLDAMQDRLTDPSGMSGIRSSGQ